MACARCLGQSMLCLYGLHHVALLCLRALRGWVCIGISSMEETVASASCGCQPPPWGVFVQREACRGIDHGGGRVVQSACHRRLRSPRRPLVVPENGAGTSHAPFLCG